MNDGSVTQIPKRDDPRRTITSVAARIEMWADTQRKRAPELDWRSFDELIRELKNAVPGQGPMKDEMKYYTARAIFMLVMDQLGDGDQTDLELPMRSALETLDEAIAI